MTDDAADSEASDGLAEEIRASDEADFPSADDYGFPDPVLEELVDLANDGAEFTITLWVGGMRISGYLVSGPSYFDATAEVVRASVPGDVGEAMATRFFGRQAEDIRAEIAQDGASQSPLPPRYLHLLSLDGQGQPQFRGRLIAIDGWNFGAPV